MIIWVDAQLSPTIATWIQNQIGIEAIAIRDIGLCYATDDQIFEAARKASAIVMTKDSDFIQILERRGAPPSIIWITCGNTSNLNLKKILQQTLTQACKLILEGDTLVEISQE